ncbi:MAG: Diaminopimelate decarboxylase [Firmicutes bacterium]|nr:Diaminopimelate decarboxylase [Bacillota bacterium]MDI6706453.1 diaminopimelate decarboxylase [Bacillota bacterium]
MKLHGSMNINSSFHLEIGGCDTVELAKEFGTPLYIMDEALIRENCKTFVRSFSKVYPNSEVIYAGKAFLTKAISRIIYQEGMSLDVVSGGELYTAYSAGFPMEKIYFHGNNKSPEEIKLALDLGVGYIVVDNINEMVTINHISAFLGKSQKVLLRISPGVTGDTHKYIQTGQLDSKFGFPVYQDIAFNAVKKALTLDNLRIEGIHCHIGSQILDIKSFVSATQAMIRFSKRLSKELGFTVKVLNLGGGFGISYTEKDREFSPQKLAVSMCKAVMDEFSGSGIELPKLAVEPGRYIVGNAGTTLYTVGSIKEIPSVRKYVFIDGGMADNPRPALYQAKYRAVVANNMKRVSGEVVTLAGKCCESSDIIVRDITLPKIKKGDLIAVLSTGAYNYSMSSNYNRLPRPAVVLVNMGKADLIVRRESYEDIIRNDLMPDRLTDS